ncbi:flagellar hook-associated protein 3 FlgL [Alkalibaculum bacchi]|uniref:Flagellar hook-associated protein 3 FlgL n=1 Tax=Alkalibaculum bacchi TaxID=645887 RepID=A0A366IHZ3_9FIRM|nr:flagellar hook-associated protein FlgL [Alkalibaculum bacchi]RBP70124.1 flagellar hook-associated protein 3 FlgL [Alkalibaculum bacchi]
MRITNQTLNKNYLRNLNKNLEKMKTYQNQISSGQEVSRPSDDPLLVSKIMSLENNILQNEQYNTNINNTLGWVQTQDTALSDVTRTLQRVRELIVYGSNGTLSDTDRNAIKDEVQMKIGQLADILNTNFDGRYIFGGQKTTESPFDENMNYIAGDDNNVTREISKGVTIEIPTAGSQITKLDSNYSLSDEENKDLGTFLENVVSALKDGSADTLSKNLLADMDQHLDNVIRVRSQIGAVYNRLESAKDRNETENLNLNSLLSQRQDVDVAEKYMEFSNMKAVYQASLSVGAQILQPSLLDYLR